MYPTFTPSEVAKLKRELATTGPDLLLRILLATGARSKELFFIQSDDYDIQRRVIFLRTVKGGVPRHVPLKPWAIVNIAMVAMDARAALIATDNPRSFTTALQRHWARRRFDILGIDPLNRTLHSFRANAATTWLKRGVPLTDIQRLLGHRSIESTIRYLQPSRVTDLREMMI